MNILKYLHWSLKFCFNRVNVKFPPKHGLPHLILLYKDSLIDPQLTPPNHQTPGQLPWVVSQLLDVSKVSREVNDGEES